MVLSNRTWQYIFVVSRAQIKDHLLNISMVKYVNPEHIPNRVKCTACCQNLDDAEEAMLFNLTSKGYKLTEPVVDEGSNQGIGSDSDPGNQDFHECIAIQGQVLLDSSLHLE